MPSSRKNPDQPQKRLSVGKESKYFLGDLCVSPGCLDDSARDLGESVLKSVIALIPANRPGNLAHKRPGVATGPELRPCVL